MIYTKYHHIIVKKKENVDILFLDADFFSSKKGMEMFSVLKLILGIKEATVVQVSPFSPRSTTQHGFLLQEL